MLHPPVIQRDVDAEARVQPPVPDPGSEHHCADGVQPCRCDVERPAPTIDDARDIMIEGESGILAICPDDERPRTLGEALYKLKVYRE